MGYDFLGANHHWMVNQECDILSSNNNDDDNNNNSYCLLSADYLPGLMPCASHTISLNPPNSLER